MTILFYPQEDDLISGSLDQKLEVLLDSAQRYKAVILDTGAKTTTVTGDKKLTTPRDLVHAYNWEEIAKLLRTIRDLPESNSTAKLVKAEKLKKLAEVYEELRAAKMAKLEAVRIALVNEAAHLSGGSRSGAAGSQVA